MKNALALVGVLAATLLAPAPAQAQSRAMLTAYDVLARPGDAVTLRFKVERDNLIRYDLRGVRVEFLLQQAGSTTWTRLGEATSAGDGYADLRSSAPAATGDHTVAARVKPGGRYASPWQYLYLGVRDASARIVVTDIDWTICAADWPMSVMDANRRIRTVNGSVQALRDMSADATVVYLTARDDYFGNKTRSWLAYRGFPRGAALFSDGVTFARDPTAYKTAEIARLKALFPNVVAGFGNKKTDHAAYTANGLWSYEWDTETRDFPQGTLIYHDFEDLRAAIRRGERPELAWATLYR